MPSTSEASSPASRIAFRTAQVPSARVVLPEPRVYVVSPTPTIAYLSRRYFGVEASTSCRGNGMGFSPLERGPLARRSDLAAAGTAAVQLVQAVKFQRGVVEHRVLLVIRIILGDPFERVPQIAVAAHPLVDREVALEHRAVRAKGGDAGLDIRAPRLGELLGRRRRVLPAHLEPHQRRHAEP